MLYAVSLGDKVDTYSDVLVAIVLSDRKVPTYCKNTQVVLDVFHPPTPGTRSLETNVLPRVIKLRLYVSREFPRLRW